MISVLASVTVTNGEMDRFLQIFKANVPEVLAEKGCIEYFPARDIETGLPPQVIDPDTVTIIEKWESVEALLAHLEAPHMAAYRKKVEGIVEGVTLKILTEA